MNRDQNRGPNSLLLASISTNFAMALNKPNFYSRAARPAPRSSVPTRIPLTLDQGHRSPPRLRTVKPGSPQPNRRLQRPRGSRRVSGWAAGSRASRRTAAPPRLEQRLRGRRRERGPATCGPTPPRPPQWLHAATGLQKPRRDPGHGPSIPPTAQRAAAGDAAAEQPSRAGWLPASGDRVPEPPTPSRGRPEPGPEEEERRARRRDPEGGTGKGRGVRLSGGAGSRETRTTEAAGRAGRSPTFLAPGRGSDASQQTVSHPGIDRHSAASAAAAAASSPAAQKRQTSGDDGDASPVRWELPETVSGALAQRSSSARTRSVDVPRG